MARMATCLRRSLRGYARGQSAALWTIRSASRGGRLARRRALGWLVTALNAARAPWCVIVACDMPFLTADWLRFLCERATGLGEESDVDAIVPESTRGLEPLCAVYRKACGKTLRGAFERGIRKVTDAPAELQLERIAETEWRAFSPDGSLFRNISTPKTTTRFAGALRRNRLQNAYRAKNRPA